LTDVNSDDPQQVCHLTIQAFANLGDLCDAALRRPHRMLELI